MSAAPLPLPAVAEGTPAPAPAPAAVTVIRHDGWTPDRQQRFLEALAEGHTVQDSCRVVGLSVASAYAFRRRAAGAGFALGWEAASLLARQHIADALTARAIDGQVERITRPDGTVIERHRYDNRLGTTLLARLDRLADATVAEGTHHAARLIAGEFDAFLSLLGRGAGPAGAGLFLGLRTAEEAPAELADLVALTRADRFLRAGAGLAAEVDTADLRPADRAGWSAEQWQRAEAAGLLRFGAPGDEQEEELEEAPRAPQLPQHRAGETRPAPPPAPVEEERVWRSPDDGWVTDFPPPPGFLGPEWGDPEEEDYYRGLTREEEAVRLARRAVTLAPRYAALARWLAVDEAARAKARGAAETGADGCAAEGPGDPPGLPLA